MTLPQLRSVVLAGGGTGGHIYPLLAYADCLRRHDPHVRVTCLGTEKGLENDLIPKAGYDLLQGWSYRNMWWVTHNPNGAFMARGVYGQALYIDPAAEMVIARFASHPVAANAASDPTSLPAYAALARHLMSR